LFSTSGRWQREAANPGGGTWRRSPRWGGPTWLWLLALVIFAGFSGQWAAVGGQESPSTSADEQGVNSSSRSGKTDGHVSEAAAARERPAEHGASGTPAADHGGGHVDPVAPVLLGIVVILLLAKVGGDLFERLGLPAVLGELAFGVIIGNFAMLSGGISYLISGTATEWHNFDFLHPEAQAGATLDILARIGVILLLFEVGLESRVHEMMSVGVSSLVVAVLGVIAPMALGYLACLWLIPEHGWQVHVFVGATLCATSVGITARVLKDLGRSQQIESRIILGAAVIDDVLGLIVLAIVSGIILHGADISVFALAKIVGLAIGFLVVALFLGAIQFPRTLFRAASYLRGHGLLVVTALVICFGFSYAANLVGLAPIIGAFAAGLILEGAHYQEVGKWENRSLEEALAPISTLLVPIFFVMMGIQVDLRQFADPAVWSLAGAITAMAIIGKQACAWGVREKGLNRLAVGLGMIPRGEVGLIFANEGRKLIVDGEPVVDAGIYSAAVVMVMVTTMVTPPLLKWAMLRGSSSVPSEPQPQDRTAHTA
jgi:Kef-type K+ transport system membrane component KefB